MAKKKTTAVAKTAKPAKTPAVSRQTTPLQHAHPAHASAKHHASAKKHKATGKHSAKTGLALHPDDVQCCAAQALAASLRLALGVTVHDEDVLALYWRTADHPDEGASILATLEAAREYGLAGLRPRSSTSLTCGNVVRDSRNCRSGGGPAFWPVEHALILRLDLPEGPHAVTTAPDGSWWSWGEPYEPADFPGAVISDAWAVTW